MPEQVERPMDEITVDLDLELARGIHLHNKLDHPGQGEE